MLTLLEEGEERLVIAVERGQIPLNVALTIHGAGNDDKSLQAALQDAYESGKLRGKPLMDVRRLLDKRRTLGRSANKQGPRKRAEVSADALVRTYEREVERQRQLVRKAKKLVFSPQSSQRKITEKKNFVSFVSFVVKTVILDCFASLAMTVKKFFEPLWL